MPPHTIIIRFGLMYISFDSQKQIDERLSTLVCTILSY